MLNKMFATIFKHRQEIIHVQWFQGMRYRLIKYYAGGGNWAYQWRDDFGIIMSTYYSLSMAEINFGTWLLYPAERALDSDN